MSRSVAVALLFAGLAFGQPGDALLRPWGGPDGFPSLYRQSIGAFFGAEDAYRKGDYPRASQILNAFWAIHPAGTEEWARAAGDAQSLGLSKGVNFGSPACYYALRMLTECVEWRMRAAASSSSSSRPIRLTVVLVGHSSGIEPASMAELRGRAGREVLHSLNAVVAMRAAELVEQSTYLFSEYMRAISGGRLRIAVNILPLPDLDVPVQVVDQSMAVAGVSRELLFAGLASGAMQKIWQSVPDEIKAKTDWWWILYPSHVPEQTAAFVRNDFITGGMGVGPDGGSPAFIIDDLWLVRVPPHLGYGEYTEAERRAFLPQWLQHEFFHHLYRTWPELKLEAVSHQWFDRRLWPRDFEGRLEPDYYAESVHKRLVSASPPLEIALRYQPPPRDLLAKINPRMLRGKYRSDPLLNDWQQGVIDWNAPPGAGAPPVLRWTNAAGVSWVLKPDLRNGVLATDESNPYYSRDLVNGRTFRIVLRRGADGEYLPDVAGFRFLGNFYAKIPPAQ